MLSHFWSRGTLFNPSTPSAAVIGSNIKSVVCWKAKIPIPSQSGHINENSVVDIIKFADYSLSKLKGTIFASQVGPSRRL